MMYNELHEKFQLLMEKSPLPQSIKESDVLVNLIRTAFFVGASTAIDLLVKRAVVTADTLFNQLDKYHANCQWWTKN